MSSPSSGRSSNGKGHYWTVHQANIDDFMRGDFRRRRAQRKVRKHMGLSCPDDEDTPSPSPTEQRSFEWPPSGPGATQAAPADSTGPLDSTEEAVELGASPASPKDGERSHILSPAVAAPRKRGFDVASLLAPDEQPPPPPPPLGLWQLGPPLQPCAIKSD